MGLSRNKPRSREKGETNFVSDNSKAHFALDEFVCVKQKFVQTNLSSRKLA